MFTRGPVRFLSLDGISFSQPVPIGSILRLTSHILHSEAREDYPALVVRNIPSLPTLYETKPPSLQHVLVQANVVDPATGEEQTTNDFRFTWCRESGAPLKRTVVPKTYKGERRFRGIFIRRC